MTPKEPAKENYETREEAEEKHFGKQMRHALSPVAMPLGDIHKGQQANLRSVPIACRDFGPGSRASALGAHAQGLE
jgi:hypothetical protein